MNFAMANEHTTYTMNQRGEESVRDTEARALLSCALKLEQARMPDSSRADFKAAIEHNQKLWTIFQSCIVDRENPLPNDLKTTILNLSVYVDKTSLSAVLDDNRDALQSLININRGLAAGLSVKTQTATTKQTAPQAPSEKHVPIMTSA